MQPQQQSYKGWNVSLSACGDSLFEAIFQPCSLYGRVEERLRNPYLENYNGSNSECKSCCAKGPLGCLSVKSQRTAIREKYGIEGSSASDCMVATCCCCCALVQHDNEVESRNPKKRETVDTTGYRPNTNSMYMAGGAERGSWFASADIRSSGYR